MQREITQEMAKDRLPRREADANKGSFGSVLAAAGSMGRRTGVRTSLSRISDTSAYDHCERFL